MRLRFLAASLIVVLAASACSDPEAAKRQHVQKGDEHMANGQFKDAVLEYRNALKIDARFGDARYKFAQALEKDGRVMDAMREYVRAAELLPDRADLQVKAGAILLAGRDFEGARKSGEAALKLDPKNLDAQLIVAHAHAGLKDLSSAVHELEEAIQLAPADSRPYTSLGTVRLASGDRREAEAAYRRAVETEPKAITPRLALAIFYLTGNARPEAEAQLKQAVALDPKNTLANRLLTLLYLTGGRTADAEAPLLRLADSDDPTAILTVADHYARTNRAAEARSMYERLKENRQNRITAVTRLAALDYVTGHREQAHAALDQEIKATPMPVDAATLKARFLLSEKRLDEAQTLAQKAVETDSNSASAYYVLGLVQIARGERDPATKSFNEVLRLNPRAGGAELQLSRLSLLAGRTDDALRRAEAARKLRPDVTSRLTVARALLARRDLARAETELRALRKEYPKVAAVHALYGGLLGAKSDIAGATRAFDQALELEPGNVEALTQRIAVDLRQKRAADARARVSRALAANPQRADLLVLAGRVEATLGNSAEAERHFRRAIDVDASTLNAYALLGQLYVRQKRLDDARAEFEKLASKNPSAIGPKTMVGMIYDVQNRPQDATRVYEEILQNTSRAPVAANNLAYNYAQAGIKLDDALRLAQSAKQQLPNSHEVDDTLGWVYYKRDMTEAAIAPLERCVKADPQNATYLAHLGLAYAKANRSDDARKTLERALQAGPDFPGADEARQTLDRLKDTSR